MAKVWAGDVGTYPVMVCIAVALGWTTYMSGRSLFYKPSVTFDPKLRSTKAAELDAEAMTKKGEAWTAGHAKVSADDVARAP